MNTNVVCAKSAPIKGSVRKLNLICEMIRGMDVSKALLQLKFSRKGASDAIMAVLNTAVANAENNNGMDVDNLYVDRIMLGKAFTLKRLRARARGRSGRIEKPFSRVMLYVKERG